MQTYPCDTHVLAIITIFLTPFIHTGQRMISAIILLMAPINCAYQSTQLFIYLLKAYSPVNRTGSPQGLFTKSNVTQVEYNTKHAHFTT